MYHGLREETDVTIDQLIMFVAVCENGSISSAAKSVFSSRQAVSKAISSLEAELNAALFTRSVGGVELTSAGKSVYTEAKIILDSRDRMLAFSLDTEDQEEDLRIGLAYGVMGALGTSLIEDFERQHPAIRLILSDDSDLAVEEKTLAGTYDACFAIEPIERTRFTVFPVFSETVYLQVYAGHPLFEKAEISLDDLKNQRFICPGPQQKGNESFLRWCSSAGFAPSIADTQGIHEFSSLETIAMREKSLFTAPESITVLDRPHVRTIPIPEDPIRWEASIAIPRGTAMTRGLTALVDFFSQAKPDTVSRQDPA